VHNIIGGSNKPRKPFPSKSIDSAEGSSSPIAALAVVAASKITPGINFGNSIFYSFSDQIKTRIKIKIALFF